MPCGIAHKILGDTRGGLSVEKNEARRIGRVRFARYAMLGAQVAGVVRKLGEPLSHVDGA